MKKLLNSLNRRNRPGPMIWIAAVVTAGSLLTYPDWIDRVDLHKIVEVVDKFVPELQLPQLIAIPLPIPVPQSGGNQSAPSKNRSAAVLTGTASVIDGDTLEIRGDRIRLHALDVPESSQICWERNREWRCGQAAALALQNKIGRSSVRCEVKNTDRYGRKVARCYQGATDLNAWLVEEGHALAWASYGKDYVAHEARAKAARRGIWKGEFVNPADWRKGLRVPQG